MSFKMFCFVILIYEMIIALPIFILHFLPLIYFVYFFNNIFFFLKKLNVHIQLVWHLLKTKTHHNHWTDLPTNLKEQKQNIKPFEQLLCYLFRIFILILAFFFIFKFTLNRNRARVKIDFYLFFFPPSLPFLGFKTIFKNVIQARKTHDS